MDEVSAHQRGAAPEAPGPVSAICPGPTAGETKPPHGAVVAPEEFRTLKPAFVSPGEHLPVPQRSDTP
ncbi:hypothetical protein CSH63_04730 [Micromonospora tulbaghiae]|uniref:Uncharacterized protein n=1 Tax=Micromonospora tulbaghiae TaxID=479978 RepID=A0A386WEN8_9ACTN|nr:hypothetical protein CSH63_04730 [Micromonospora tulbaghiae]